MNARTRLARLETRSMANGWRPFRRLIEWPEDPPGHADRLAGDLEAQGFNVIIRRVVEAQQT
jgi:hypothetical protein